MYNKKHVGKIKALHAPK